MKRMMVLAMAISLSACATAQMRTSHTHEMIDNQPIFQMMTEVCDPFGNECIVVQTFQRQDDGTVGLIDSKAVGGPGIGYAMGVGVTAGTGAAATGGLLGVWAAHELRPDQTNVQQVGGGATSNAQGGAGGAGGQGGVAVAGAVATSESVSAAEGGDATQNLTNRNYNTNVNENTNANLNLNSMRQSQGQQQQQQQQQRIQPAPAPVQQPPKCNKPAPVPSSPQVQGQAQILNVR